MGCVGVLGTREREREALQRRERKPSYPATTHVKGEKMANSAIKMALFCSIVFFFYNSELNSVLLYKTHRFI
jgi:hypothetical protein